METGNRRTPRQQGARETGLEFQGQGYSQPCRQRLGAHTPESGVTGAITRCSRCLGDAEEQTPVKETQAHRHRSREVD